MARFALFTLFFLIGFQPATAQPFESKAVDKFAGRTVLLLVGEPQVTQAWAQRYHRLLKEVGVDPKLYQSYQAGSLPPEISSRLGVQNQAPPYAALVRWGNPARFGPSKILTSGVVNDPASDSDTFGLVEDAVLDAGRGVLLDRLPNALQELRPRPRLSITEHNFQANGNPLFVLNAQVKLANSGNRPAQDVTVIFWVENPLDKAWVELGRQTNFVVKAGQSSTRDLVSSTHGTPLLNANREVQPVRYRIQVESSEGNFELVDEFNPTALKDQN